VTAQAANHPDIRGLLLCGGRATRFGSDKLLADLDGEPLVARSVANLLKGAGNALAVVPPGEIPLLRVLERAGCYILESADTRRGLGASLAAGVAHTREADGWIVALGDMPFIAPATIAMVRARLEAGAVLVAPALAGSERRGHPVGFGRALRDELLAIDADEGARSVIARHLPELVMLPVEDKGIVIDIDTPSDLEGRRR
jgi:molybdenum cofactor cytidylyltransferase